MVCDLGLELLCSLVKLLDITLIKFRKRAPSFRAASENRTDSVSQVVLNLKTF